MNSSANFEADDPFERLLLVAKYLVCNEEDAQEIHNFLVHTRKVFARYPDTKRKRIFRYLIGATLKDHPSDAFLGEGIRVLAEYFQHGPTQEGIPGWVWYLLGHNLPDDDPVFCLVCALYAMLTPYEGTHPFCPLRNFFQQVEKAGYSSILQPSDKAFFVDLYLFVNLAGGEVYPFDPQQHKSPFFEALDGFLADFWTADFWEAFELVS
jgi:hypothetical protein